MWKWILIIGIFVLILIVLIIRKINSRSESKEGFFAGIKGTIDNCCGGIKGGIEKLFGR